MKDLKKTFAQNFAVSAVSSAAILAFMNVPFLEGTRNSLGASPALLWVLAATLIIAIQFFTFRRSLKLVASPLNRLMKEAEHGEQGFAFKTRAKTKEEDGIKHAIEAANLRARESGDQAEELEAELEKTSQTLADETTKSATLQSRYDEIESSTRDIRVENETLKAAKTALELTLENERKSKVGAEVEKRTEEIYTQMERAVSAAAIKSVWIPSLVHELKTPITLINQLSSKLSTSWQERSLKEVGQEIEAIVAQSETQLSLLNEILERQPPLEKPEPPALAVEPEDEAPQTEAPAVEPTFSSEQVPEPETIIEMTKDIELEEPEKEEEPLAIGLETEPKQPTETAPSPHSLETILGNLVEEFSRKIVDVHYSISLDRDLDIELEDPTMLRLLRTLAESASHCTLEGEVVFGVDLQPENLVFDVVCNGKLNQQIDPVLISRAERDANELGGQIEIESTTATELHLSFNYPLGTPETSKEPIDLEQVFDID
ncbi:hypothetical protein [Pelagicoccus mobilis]|uniref:Uncharacterized protein n=1 Tax=Pelagicoccus mobilis TaxID=415221 RepID=A0A934RYZ5_9BACT|nr:hypothetical protein [Pelagicoccus mobilis]MBK1878923.1 hypothetical protein [Pelagicoccus mobilis]